MRSEKLPGSRKTHYFWRGRIRRRPVDVDGDGSGTAAGDRLDVHTPATGGGTHRNPSEMLAPGYILGGSAADWAVCQDFVAVDRNRIPENGSVPKVVLIPWSWELF